MPAETAPHLPSLSPVFEPMHALQRPPQAVSQHTPSTHAPAVHWLAEAQALPLPFFAWQVPPAQ